MKRTKFVLRRSGQCWRLSLDGDERSVAEWARLRNALPKSIKALLRIQYSAWDDALVGARSAVWISRNIGGIASLTRGFGS